MSSTELASGYTAYTDAASLRSEQGGAGRTIVPTPTTFPSTTFPSTITFPTLP